VPGWGAGVTPDGTTIVFAGKESKTSGLHMSIWTLGIDGTRLKQVTNTPDEYTDMFPCCSPDGNQIAFVRFRAPDVLYLHPKDTRIYIIRNNGGEPIPLAGETNLVKPCPIAWSPDGKLIAYYAGEIEAKGKGTLNVIPVDGGESRLIGEVKGIGIHKELAWSPDSGRIAFNDPEGKVIKVISLKDGSVEDISTGLVDTWIYHLDWSPDGSRLVFSGRTGGEREFWVMENFLPSDKRK
jgi:Tol biopolymer transport system component